MRYLAVSAVVIALPLTWFAGEHHRSNCIREHRIACSVLPWVNGHTVPAVAVSPAEQREVNAIASQAQRDADFARRAAGR